MSWNLSEFSDTLSRLGNERREKQDLARIAIEAAEAEVPLTKEAEDILMKIDHLRRLISSRDTFGAADQDHADDIGLAVKDLRKWLNGLKETVPCEFVK